MGEALERVVDRGEVAGDGRLATLRIGLLDEALDPGDCLVRRQDAGELEEARLPIPASSATASASITQKSISFSMSSCWTPPGR